MSRQEINSQSADHESSIQNNMSLGHSKSANQQRGQNQSAVFGNNNTINFHSSDMLDFMIEQARSKDAQISRQTSYITDLSQSDYFENTNNILCEF